MLGNVIGDVVGFRRELFFEAGCDLGVAGKVETPAADARLMCAVIDVMFNEATPAEALRRWCACAVASNRFRVQAWVTPAAYLAPSLNTAVQMTRSISTAARRAAAFGEVEAVVQAQHQALMTRSAQAVLELMHARFYPSMLSVSEYGQVPASLGGDVVPRAVAAATEARSFEEAICLALSMEGDSATIAAVAGGLAEALYGIPRSLVTQAEGALPADLKEALRRAYKTSRYPSVF